MREHSYSGIFLNKKIGDEVVVPDDICLSNCVGATSGRPCRSSVKPCISALFGTLWSQVLPPQNRFALCGFYFVQEDRKAVQILFLRYTFIIKHYFYMLFCFTLHRLVGLRRMRLCLILRQGFALYPQGVSPLDPDQGRVPGPFARFARC